MQQLDYRCAQLNPSDHKPVSALFSCGVRTIVEERKKVVFKQLIDVLKKHNSNELPKVEVKGLQIKLDRVCFEEPVVSNIDMVNQGQSIAHWRFVPKLNEDRICKRWISVDTESGLLLPGESIRLAVTVQVDTQSAHALNAGKDVLEDLIVIRIEQSVDFHVIVSAAYQRSCFGVSLMELVRTSDAIVNTVQLTERAKSVARGPISTAAAPEEQEGSEEMSIPKELWRMVDGLWSGSALKEKDLFNSKSDPQEVTTVQLLLSTSDMMDPCRLMDPPHRTVGCCHQEEPRRWLGPAQLHAPFSMRRPHTLHRSAAAAVAATRAVPNCKRYSDVYASPGLSSSTFWFTDRNRCC